MLLPHEMQPQPPPPPPPPPKPVPKKRAPRKKASPGAAAKTTAARATTSSRRSTKLPKSATDTPPALFGDKDLAYEIPDGTLRYHIEGADSTWLPISAMPRELRDGGSVYLQSDRKLVARCRVQGVGFRDQRWTHADPKETVDAGPGATLDLHEDDWELVSIDLGKEGETELKGYRYLISDEDGSVRPVPDKAAK